MVMPSWEEMMAYATWQDKMYRQMMAYAVWDAKLALTTMGFDDMVADRVLGKIDKVNLKGLINEPGILSFKDYAEITFGPLKGVHPIDEMLNGS